MTVRFSALLRYDADFEEDKTGHDPNWFDLDNHLNSATTTWISVVLSWMHVSSYSRQIGQHPYPNKQSKYPSQQCSRATTITQHNQYLPKIRRENESFCVEFPTIRTLLHYIEDIYSIKLRIMTLLILDLRIDWKVDRITFPDRITICKKI